MEWVDPIEKRPNQHAAEQHGQADDRKRPLRGGRRQTGIDRQRHEVDHGRPHAHDKQENAEAQPPPVGAAADGFAQGDAALQGVGVVRLTPPLAEQEPGDRDGQQRHRAGRGKAGAPAEIHDDGARA